MARLVLGRRFARAAKERPWLQRLLWRAEAAGIGLPLALLAALPADRASALGRRCMSRLGPRLGKHRKLKANLERAFPERSAPELEQLAVAVWGNVGAALAEYGHLGRICRDAAGGRLEIVQRSDIRAFRPGGGPAIFVTAHLSNFELGAAAARRLAGSLTVAYRPLKNPWLEARLASYRRSTGCNLAPLDRAPRLLVNELRAGRSIGVVMDQNQERGALLPFLGFQKPTTLVPARLAIRCGVELVPVQTERLGGSRFRVTFHAPVPHGDPDAPEFERALRMTGAVNRLFETWIRAAPEEWLTLNLAKAGAQPSAQPRPCLARPDAASG